MVNPLFEGRRACAEGMSPAACPYGLRDPRKRTWLVAYRTEARERGLCGNCGTAIDVSSRGAAGGHVCDLGRVLKDPRAGARDSAPDDAPAAGGHAFAPGAK